MNRDRPVRVFRIWTRLFGEPRFLVRRAWWAAGGTKTLNLGLGCLALGSCIPIELALWRVGGLGFLGLAKVPVGWMGLAFLVTWLASALVFDGLLRDKLREHRTPRCSYRVLRALVTGFPAFGLASIPLWRDWAEDAPRLAYRPPLSREPQNGGAPDATSWSAPWAARASYWLVILGFSIVAFYAIWLAAPSEPSLGRRTALLGSTIALHVVGLSASLAHSLRRIRSGATRWRLLGSALWLLPLPFPIAAVLLDIHVERDGSLVRKAFVGREDLERRAEWIELRATVRASWMNEPWWRRWRQPTGRRVAPALSADVGPILLACRVKLSLLVTDGVVVGWILHRAGVSLIRLPWVGGCLAVLSGVAVAGILSLLVRHLATAVRMAPEPHPLGSHRRLAYSAFGAAGLGLGLVAGCGFASGSHRESGLILALGATLSQALGGLWMILRGVVASWLPVRPLAELSAWSANALAFVAGAVLLAWAHPSTPVMEVVLAICLFHAVFFVLVRRPLDRYLHVDLGGVARFPRLAILATALAPVGGITVPAWLWLGRRREERCPLGAR